MHVALLLALALGAAVVGGYVLVQSALQDDAEEADEGLTQTRAKKTRDKPMSDDEPTGKEPASVVERPRSLLAPGVLTPLNVHLRALAETPVSGGAGGSDPPSGTPGPPEPPLPPAGPGTNEIMALLEDVEEHVVPLLPGDVRDLYWRTIRPTLLSTTSTLLDALGGGLPIPGLEPECMVPVSGLQVCVPPATSEPGSVPFCVDAGTVEQCVSPSQVCAAGVCIDPSNPQPPACVPVGGVGCVPPSEVCVDGVGCLPPSEVCQEPAGCVSIPPEEPEIPDCVEVGDQCISLHEVCHEAVGCVPIPPEVPEVPEAPEPPVGIPEVPEPPVGPPEVPTCVAALELCVEDVVAAVKGLLGDQGLWPLCTPPVEDVAPATCVDV